jgi:hypothetical protein
MRNVLRVLVLVATTATLVMVSLASEAGFDALDTGSTDVRPQVITVPVSKAPAELPRAAHGPTRVVDEPVRAKLAVTDAAVRDCIGEPGAETKLGMMENSAIWGHCGTIE